MTASAWLLGAPSARILCAGDNLGELVQMQCHLEGELDIVIVASQEETDTVLFDESPFDIIIVDQHIARLGGSRFLERLGRHSPDAERLVVLHHDEDATVAEMLASDSRLMRLLRVPVAAEVLCVAVADALLRHRARALRASAVPRVTPAGGNFCCSWSTPT